MPRRMRKRSSTGIYHIVFRGINRQRIFKGEEDFGKFLETLNRSKEKSGCSIYAYCLMDNHVHILLKEGAEELGTTFKRFGAAYVYWYNWKYKRSGHLFQDRFRSEVVETEKYLLTVLRYIHQNPVKAGMVARAEDYRWSSFQEYLKEPQICDTKFMLGLFSANLPSALAEFKRFHLEKNEDRCLEFDEGIRLNDQEAIDIIKKIAAVDNVGEILAWNKLNRKRVFEQCREAGLSIRQLARLTGISVGRIRGIISQQTR
jgi:putative transposase